MLRAKVADPNGTYLAHGDQLLGTRCSRGSTCWESLGSGLAIDLRWLGVGREVLPVSTFSRYRLRLSYGGSAVALMTGTTMFTGIAVGVSSSVAAPWKFALLQVASANVILFHRGVYRTGQSLGLHVPIHGPRGPLQSCRHAHGSACTWVGVLAACRYLAYV